MQRSVCLLLAVLAAAVAPVWADGEGPAQRLAEAVRYRTVSHQDETQLDRREFARFHNFLRRSFPRVFSTLEIETVNDYSLLLHWPGSDPALSPILFTAHLDVVPVEPGTESGWTHPPFAGVITADRVYGRGTLDDKQGLLGLLEAAEGLLAEGFSPRRSVMFAFGHDEEVGGRRGAHALAARMRERNWHFAWMVDEGGMIIADFPMLEQRAVAMVNVAEKGYVTLTLVATGEGGHSSTPPRVSTIGRLSAALAKIENDPFPPRLSRPVRATLESLAPHLDQPYRFILGNLWLTGPFVARYLGEDRLSNSFVRSTTALTLFRAGVKENVVPQRAEASVNFRLLPGDTPEQLLQRIRTIVDDPEIAISVDGWDNVPPVSDASGEGFRVIADAVTAVAPEVLVVPSLLTATTDTRHYIELADEQYRFHGVSMDYRQVSSIHGTDEFIGRQSYLDSIAVAREMLRRGASPARR